MNYSYYHPGLGTVGIVFERPACDPVMTGETRDMIVACDLSRVVYCFIDRSVVWSREFPASWPRAVAVYEGLLFVGDGMEISAMAPRTGHVHRTLSVPNAPGPVNGLQVTTYKGETWVVVCFAVEGVGTVRAYTMTDLTLTERFVNPLPAAHPRHAELIAGRIFVCDTFGHEVYAVTLTGQKRDSVAVYYPNHIQMLASNVGLITAEHENRIVRWQYAPSVVFTLELAAPVAPFDRPEERKSEIMTLEGSTLNPASTLIPQKSLVAIEAQPSGYTLYSPNSARRYGDDLLVTDTDNHRVIVERAGAIVTEITGFNNPVTAVLI